jgi:transcriptional regulator with XRE-family HTH domain
MYDNLTLVQLREIKKIPQSKIREKLGLSDRSFRGKEKGDNEFTFTQFKKLADIYEMSLDEMAKIVTNTLEFKKLKSK